ncbi:MAG: hypothetical protein WA012_06600 [Rhodoferax sp.]|uniref:hypothetical protein n=1 Tax=Rhodoferax sp. TaxID=50421 RepID=UPI003BB0C465
MNSPVIANPSTLRQAQDRLSSGQAVVKQSMSLDCMDCRALACPEFIEGLAVTKALFKVRARYLAGYGGLAMTLSFCFP